MGGLRYCKGGRQHYGLFSEGFFDLFLIFRIGFTVPIIIVIRKQFLESLRILMEQLTFGFNVIPQALHVGIRLLAELHFRLGISPPLPDSHIWTPDFDTRQQFHFFCL